MYSSSSPRAPQREDLSLWRSATALAGVGVLLFGLIWNRGDAAMNIFLWGATAMGCLAVGLIFFRSWRFSGDRFFALFGAVFWLLAVH